ncbi:MAG: late control protein [Roseivirga sp.]|nr:late control protein [Roseivirga sp.]
MFILTCQIKIGDITLNQINDVKIEKSWRNLDDKAMLKLPRVNKLLSKNFEVGQPVTITLAYEGEPSKVEFEGYLKKIKPNVPLVLECEDPTWLLRQTNIENVWKTSTTVKEIVAYIVEQVNKENVATPITLSEDIKKIKLDHYRIQPVSAAEAINQLKKSYGLAAYFRGHELYIGMAYGKLEGRVGYHMARNVIKNNLTFRRKEDVKIKVKATSITKDNKTLTIESGDKQGDQRTLFFYNITDENVLKARVETELGKLKFDGFEGSLSTFLIPYATPGMTAVITDPDHPKLKNGSYVIDSVTTTFGVRGARRKVELGALVAATTNEPDET